MTTNNPSPQQNKPSSSFGQTQGNRDATQGNRDATQGNRQDAGKAQGSGETQQFGGIRGGVEQSYGSEKSSRSGSQDIERCLSAIEENCQKLRQAISASGSSSDMSRSESSDSSSRSSGSQDRSNQGGSQDRGSQSGSQDRSSPGGRSTSR
jgi:hypothetical protein